MKGMYKKQNTSNYSSQQQQQSSLKKDYSNEKISEKQLKNQSLVQLQHQQIMGQSSTSSSSASSQHQTQQQQQGILSNSTNLNSDHVKQMKNQFNDNTKLPPQANQISNFQQQQQSAYAGGQEILVENQQQSQQLPINSEKMFKKLNVGLQEIYQEIFDNFDNYQQNLLKKQLRLDHQQQLQGSNYQQQQQFLIVQLKQLVQFLIKQKKELEVQLNKQNQSEQSEYETLIQKLEAEVRQHIAIEQQLKLYAETTQSKLEEIEKTNGKTINDLKIENQDFTDKFKQQQDEIQNLKKHLADKTEALQKQEEKYKQMVLQTQQQQQQQLQNQQQQQQQRSTSQKPQQQQEMSLNNSIVGQQQPGFNKTQSYNQIQQQSQQSSQQQQGEAAQGSAISSINLFNERIVKINENDKNNYQANSQTKYSLFEKTREIEKLKKELQMKNQEQVLNNKKQSSSIMSSSKAIQSASSHNNANNNKENNRTQNNSNQNKDGLDHNIKKYFMSKLEEKEDEILKLKQQLNSYGFKADEDLGNISLSSSAEDINNLAQNINHLNKSQPFQENSFSQQHKHNHSRNKSIAHNNHNTSNSSFVSREKQNHNQLLDYNNKENTKVQSSQQPQQQQQQQKLQNASQYAQILYKTAQNLNNSYNSKNYNLKNPQNYNLTNNNNSPQFKKTQQFSGSIVEQQSVNNNKYEDYKAKLNTANERKNLYESKESKQDIKPSTQIQHDEMKISNMTSPKLKFDVHRSLSVDGTNKNYRANKQKTTQEQPKQQQQLQQYTASFNNNFQPHQQSQQQDTMLNSLQKSQQQQAYSQQSQNAYHNYIKQNKKNTNSFLSTTNFSGLIKS